MEQLATAADAPSAGVSLGKGAWDCDNNCEIPPEKEVGTRSMQYCVCGATQALGPCYPYAWPLGLGED
jgi:hypothetical protein